MGSGGKNRWKISFHRSSSRSQQKPPSEFVCPISSSLMADPVIVSTGQTFERTCAQACKDLGFVPLLSDGSRPDLSSLIPNLALKSTILNWCDHSGAPLPNPLKPDAARELVRALMEAEKGKEGEKGKTQKVIDEKELLLRRVSENPHQKFSYAATEVNRRPKHFYSSSEESLVTTPLPLATKPSCYSSSSSSSEIVGADVALALGPNSTQEQKGEEEDEEDEEIFANLKGPQIFEQEEAVVRLRNITRSCQEKRINLCTPRLLAALRPLLASRYSAIQANTVAVMVNLSLEKPNKVKIVRSGAVPPLVDALRSGFLEAQEHAAGALFSLALEDENKTAIGVLGALPPLLHMLRSESERGRQDAALALYHLTLVQSNRSKLVKLGAVPALLALVRGGELASRVLIILCNLASGADGRVALLDADAVEVFVEMLNQKDVESAVREHCIAVLFALSQSSLRFKGSANAAGAVEVLMEVAERGSERARQKVKKMLMLLKEKEEGVAVVTLGDEGEAENGVGGNDGERVSDSVVGAFRQQHRYKLHKGKNISGAYSTEF